MWSQVDLTRRCAWIHPDQVKARKAIAVPLSAAGVIILREQMGKHPEVVFTYQGKPIRQVNTKAWRSAPAGAPARLIWIKVRTAGPPHNRSTPTAWERAP
jgi:integrase